MKTKLFAIFLVLLTATLARAVPTPTATATATATPVPTPVVYPHAWNGITDNQGHSATVVNGALAVTAASAGTGGVVPGNNDFFVNPDNIAPNGTGNIWFNNCTSGSDSADGKSPATATLTVQHAVDLAGDGTNDVIVMSPTWPSDTCTENVTVTKNRVNIICGAGWQAWSDKCDILSASGVAMTVTGQNDSFFNLTLGTNGSASTDFGLVVGPHSGGVGHGDGAYFKNVFFGGGDDTHAAQILDASNVRFDDPQFFYGGLELKYVAAPVANIYLNRPLWNFHAGDPDVYLTGTAGDHWQTIEIDHGIHSDPNKAVYYDFSSENTPDASGMIISNDYFNVTTVLAVSASVGQVKLGSNGSLIGSHPSGEIGSSISSSPTNTLISSHITTAAAQNIFTASGDIDITDIALTTNSTGLAGGTNFVLSTDNTSGALTLCSNAVATLGASVSVKCSAAGVTTLKPFRLLSGKHILATCSVGDCTGAGTITVTPIATRAAPYASFTNVALP